MTRRRIDAYLDGLAEGRRPGSLDADPEDAEILRTAIELRAARPGDTVPDETFVSGLYEELKARAGSGVVPITRSVKVRRRTAVVAVAAGLVLVGGTAAATEALSQASVSPAAVQVPHGTSVRTGTFETADGQVMGQIVAYRGNPSWVAMNVGGSTYSGPIVCTLQVENGSTVASGSFMLKDGKGELSKTIQVDVARLRGAKLVTSSGDVVAAATFV